MILFFKGIEMFTLRPIILTVPLVALTACGGGTGPVAVEEVRAPDGGGTVVDAKPISDTGNQQPLADTGTSRPEVGVQSDPALLATLAAVNAATTSITATSIVTDSNGNRRAQTRDGVYTRTGEAVTIAGLAASVTNDVLGDYDNAASFFQDDGTVGVVGIATPTASMPTSGNARYAGGASGFVITGTNGVDLTDGRSVVDVAFGGGVTVTLDDFVGVSQLSGNVVASPVSEMILTNAVIADGGFSGGTLSLRDENGAVDITGSDSTTVAQGQFFGVNADGVTPDEVGGVLFSEGRDGTVYGTFIAD